MIYGYARVSTRSQAREGNSLDAQEELLHEAGAAVIYKDTYSGVKNDRPQLDALLNVLSCGDILVVTKLDRIARSATAGFELIQSLLDRRIIVKVLNIGQIDNTTTGKLILHILLAFAEFERDMIIERTQEGKEIARTSGKLKEGRPHKFSANQINHAIELCNSYPISEVVRLTGISKSTIMRAKALIKSKTE